MRNTILISFDRFPWEENHMQLSQLKRNKLMSCQEQIK